MLAAGEPTSLIDNTAVQLASVVLLGIGAQWIAWRLRAPAILLLLLAGILAGPVAPVLGLPKPLIRPDELFGELLFPWVALSVAVILFEGGLSLKIRELKHVGAVVRNLVTIGALAAWFTGAAGAYWIAGLDGRLALLLGALLVVTGPTVIGPLLQQVRPRGAVGSVLKWEGIVIDPVGVLLAVLVFEVLLFQHESGPLATASLGLLNTLLVGGGLGAAGSYAVLLMIKRNWIPDFLQSSIMLAIVFACFTISNVVQEESGLFTVTLMGFICANQRTTDVRHIIEFKENLRTLLISCLFIVLAARIELDGLGAIWLRGLLFAGVLIVVARPLAVLVSTVGSPLNWRERVFLASVAPRGIVAAAGASIFALALESQQVAGSELLVPLTFIVIIVTVTVYGLAAGPLARLLKLAEANPQGLLIVGAHPFAQQISRVLTERKFPVLLVDTNRHLTNQARLGGIRVHGGNILSEHVHDELDLGGIGRLLALTPNDSVNALACQHFAHAFGRVNVFQLTNKRGGTQEPPAYLRGEHLFSNAATYDLISERVGNGGGVKATQLTEKFGLEAFRARYGDDAIPLFVLTEPKSATESRKLRIIRAGEKLSLSPGQTLISLVPED